MTIAELRSHITELALSPIEALDGFLVDITVKPEGASTVLEVLFDTDAGVTIGQCAQVNRELNRAIEIHQLIEGSYRLEVSSPGIDRPLKLLRQYCKNLGREYRVRYRSEGTVLDFVGRLEAINEQCITFQPKHSEPVVLEFESILESIEVLPW
jgi:ribosome maturation factor RimP